MLQANELRIGNWLLEKTELETRYIQCSYTHIQDIANGADETLFPIRLTPLLLENFGFIKGELDVGKYFYLWWSDETEGVYLKHDWYILEKKIQYLHQLQNMYFSLTGKELEGYL